MKLGAGIDRLTDRMLRNKPPPDEKKFAFKSNFKNVEVLGSASPPYPTSMPCS